jgi:hypothetical protein
MPWLFGEVPCTYMTHNLRFFDKYRCEYISSSPYHACIRVRPHISSGHSSVVSSVKPVRVPIYVHTSIQSQSPLNTGCNQFCPVINFLDLTCEYQ